MIVVEKKDNKEVWGDRELGLLAGISENITPIEPTDEDYDLNIKALLEEIFNT